MMDTRAEGVLAAELEGWQVDPAAILKADLARARSPRFRKRPAPINEHSLQYRRRTVSWFAQAASHYKLPSRAVPLAVDLYDRVTGACRDDPDLHRLCAIVCLIMAAKMEGSGAISMTSVPHLSCGTYRAAHGTQAEMHIGGWLDWALTPTLAADIVGGICYTARAPAAAAACSRVGGMALALLHAALGDRVTMEVAAPELAVAAMLSAARAAALPVHQWEALKAHCRATGAVQEWGPILECCQSLRALISPGDPPSLDAAAPPPATPSATRKRARPQSTSPTSVANVEEVLSRAAAAAAGVPAARKRRRARVAS